MAQPHGRARDDAGRRRGEEAACLVRLVGAWFWVRVRVRVRVRRRGGRMPRAPGRGERLRGEAWG